MSIVIEGFTNGQKAQGIYSAQTDLKMIARWSGATIFKSSFVFRVSPDFDGNFPFNVEDFIKEFQVQPNALNVAVFDLADAVQKTQWFENQDIAENNEPLVTGYLPFNPKTLSTFKVEVGITYATAANLPPLFQGYTVEFTLDIFKGKLNLVQEILTPNYKNAFFIEPKFFTNKKIFKFRQNEPINLSFAKEILRNDGYYVSRIISYKINGAGSFIEYDFSGAYDESLNYTNTALLNSVLSADFGLQFDITWNKIELFVRYVLVGFGSGPAFLDTQTITFERVQENSRYQPYRIYWLNESEVMYDSIPLEGRTVKRVNVANRERIKLPDTNFNTNQFIRLGSRFTAQTAEFSNDTTNRYILNTGAISPEDSLALKNLYSAKKVYLLTPDNQIVPVLIEDSDYEIQNIDRVTGFVSVQINAIDAND